MQNFPVLLGRRSDLTVREWLSLHASTIVRLPYVMVSAIDSDTDVARMPWVAARRLADPAWGLGFSPLVLSGESVIDLLADPNIFTGFDELWIPGSLPVVRPPDDASLVAPRQLDREAPSAVSEWLDASGCRIGVGDGDGMNYAVRDAELGAELGLT